MFKIFSLLVACTAPFVVASTANNLRGDAPARHLAATASESPEYIGCFSDVKEDRVLTRVQVDIAAMSESVCRAACKDKSSDFYATQFGGECWCGKSDEVDDYERHGPGVCDFECNGDTSVACGGYDSFSLYRMGTEESVPEESAPSPAPGPKTSPCISSRK